MTKIVYKITQVTTEERAITNFEAFKAGYLSAAYLDCTYEPLDKEKELLVFNPQTMEIILYTMRREQTAE